MTSPRTASTRTCLLIAGLVAVAGVGLRMAIPVTPVDAAFAEVVRLYRVIE